MAATYTQLEQQKEREKVAKELPKPKSVNTKKIGLVIGETGVGKSSLIRHTLNVSAVISDGPLGCTTNVTRYEDDNIVLYDSCGFNESALGKVSPAQAFVDILCFINRIKDGLNFIIMVHRGRITESLVQNYHFFRNVVFGSSSPEERIPMILVMTGCESEAIGPSWWARKKENLEAFRNQGFEFDRIISTSFASADKSPLEGIYSKIRQDSIIHVREVIDQNSLAKPSKEYLSRAEYLIQKIWNHVVSRFEGLKQYAWVSSDIISALVKIPGIDLKEAKRVGALVTNFEQFKSMVRDIFGYVRGSQAVASVETKKETVELVDLPKN
jgi:GTPase SAR1 family protein